MKKVLFVATVVKTHMMQFHIPYLKMFKDMGWETAVASRNDYENPADCVIPYCDAYYDIPFERTPWKPENIRSYKMLKAIMDEGNYDIIHCHTPVGALIARLAALKARKKGTKVIYTAHGFHFFKGAPLVNWLCYFPFEWLLSFVTDVLITINKEDYARAKKIMHPKRLEYVPGVGIHTEKFRTDTITPREKRKELGFTEEDFLMVTVAEMTKNKNHITILKAMEILKGTAAYDHLHYLIVGRGEQWESLEESAKELGIANHVHFLGYRSDTPQLYRCCDVFAFMPFREGLSVALMEAMASGIPIYCSKIRGNTDLIQDGISGLFADNNVPAVAKTIEALYGDLELRAKLGAGAMERAKLFDDENVHRMMKEIYLSV